MGLLGVLMMIARVLFENAAAVSESCYQSGRPGPGSKTDEARRGAGEIASGP